MRGLTVHAASPLFMPKIIKYRNYVDKMNEKQIILRNFASKLNI